jgi:hypothetical protein
MSPTMMITQQIVDRIHLCHVWQNFQTLQMFEVIIDDQKQRLMQYSIW